ncbi:hypothetical protein SLEP1_g28150 [Rubroshorea leprosula]|uniref:Uncharacterized protein n=1 Tax=Rubroshorea leprosula TaxID=152421 RepID=A0AAV5K3M8_9ROSI|nr:hypothetical protein SLEP1_g28150 [Rubroshorea leprosula]
MELVLGGDSRRTCNPCVDEVEWWSMELLLHWLLWQFENCLPLPV